MMQSRTRRRAWAAVATVALAPALAACSFEVGDVEPIGEDSTPTAEESAPAESDEATEPADESAPAEPTTVRAEHISVRIPSDWQSVGDADNWSYVHQLPNDNGGIDGRIGFMPGGAEMNAQESVDWFISQVEGQGVTDENYAAVTTLREDPNRANTSYTYSSDGESYTAVVWGLTDGNGIPSLVQLSGTQDVMTQDFVAQVDQSLNLSGNWEGKGQAG
jgi:hypothetical protein